jgi:hypothetical protein
MNDSDSQTPARPRGFDLRVLIAGMMGLYGAVLTVMGVTDGKAELAKADGIRINLWIGLGLLAVAAAFALWVKLSPQHTDHHNQNHDRAPDSDRAHKQ